MLLSVDDEAVNFRSKRSSHGASRSIELDNLATWSDLDSCESLRCQPASHSLNVGIGRTKLLAELLGCHPGVIVRGGFALLVIEELTQGGFLVGTPLQEQEDSVQGLRVGHCALIELRAGEGVDVALQDDEVLLIHGLSDARWNDTRLRGSAPKRAGQKRDEKQDTMAHRSSLESHNPPTQWIQVEILQPGDAGRLVII
jgi:hypothetical protein